MKYSNNYSDFLSKKAVTSYLGFIVYANVCAVLQPVQTSCCQTNCQGF